MLFALLLFAQDQGSKPAAPEGPGGGFGGQLLMFLPIIVLGYLFLWRPMKQQQKQQQLLIASLKKNDEVLTSGGIYGIVVSVKDDEVALKIDDNSPVRLRVSKSSIGRILNREPSAEKEAPKDKKDDKKDKESQAESETEG